MIISELGKIIAVCLSFVTCISTNPCEFNVKLRYTLLNNEGFHRNMTYTITFDTKIDEEKWIFKECIVGLEQTFPPGVFTNSDELLEFRQSHKLRAIPKNKINVELPAEHAQPSTVYMVGKVSNSKVKLWLPVHGRYHQAVSGGGNARNIIAPPKLYLRCPDQRLDLCKNEMVTSHTFLCNVGSKEKCSWKELPFNLVTAQLTWDVPVGNTDYYYIVATGTTAAVVLGSIYILKAIHDFKMDTRKKKND